MKTFNLNVSYLTIATSVVLPLLTGFVTKLNAERRVKAFVLLALSLAAGAAQALIAKHGVLSWTTWTDNTVATYVFAYIAHSAFLKPTGVTDVVTNAAPDFGLGAPTSTTESGVAVPTVPDSPTGATPDSAELIEIGSRLGFD